MAIAVLPLAADALAQDELPPPTPVEELDVQSAALGLIPTGSAQIAPAERFADGNGNSVSLNDFRGRVVLVHIWATWCVPWCREELPKLDALQAKLGASDLKVVAVSVDRNGADVVPSFFSELHLSHLDIYLDPSERLARALRTVGVPTTLIFDRDGREIGRAFGSRDWNHPAVLSLIRRFIIGPDDSGFPADR